MTITEAIAAVKRTTPRPEELDVWRAYSEYTCHFIRNPIAGHIAQFGSQHQRDRAVNAVNAAPLLIAEVGRLQTQLAAARVAVEALAPYKHTQLRCSPREGCYCGADASNAARTEARRALRLEVGNER